MLIALVVVLSGAMASAGVAMASSDISDGTHCLKEIHAMAPDTGAEPAGHDHLHHAPAATDPAHDHETCTQHSCPALSVETSLLGEATDLALVALRASEIGLRVLSVPHDLSRPPRA